MVVLHGQNCTSPPTPSSLDSTFNSQAQRGTTSLYIGECPFSRICSSYFINDPNLKKQARDFPSTLLKNEKDPQF